MFTWKSNKDSSLLMSQAHKHRPKPQSPSTVRASHGTDTQTPRQQHLRFKNKQGNPGCSVFPARGNPSFPGWVGRGALWFLRLGEERECCHECPLLPDKGWVLGRRQHPLPVIPAESLSQVKGMEAHICWGKSVKSAGKSQGSCSASCSAVPCGKGGT